MNQLDVDQRDRKTLATYRCVCGEVLAWRGESERCGQCGREYDAEFLRAAGVDTLSIDSALSPVLLVKRGDDDPYLGRQLGHFRILSRIGSGGMGAVYHALDESLQRYVALKVIQRATNQPEATDLDRLFQEARAQARVNHPNVVHVYFVGIDDETPFLAMELVGKGTLADRLREGPIPFGEVIRQAIQITRALGCAAEFDIVHGDIKPSNVLRVDDYTVKLSDFGLARRISGSDASPSKFSGTPDYMPPESTEGEGFDHRGDMYSLGVTLFQLTFCRLPYSVPRGSDVSDRLRLHREAEVEFPERWPLDYPEGWRDVLARLLDKNPAARYPDFAALESDLRLLAPINLPVAGPLLRGLAWLIDGALLTAGLALIQALTTLVIMFVRHGFQLGTSGIPDLGLTGNLFNFCAGVCFLVSIGLLQAQWGSTTGKRFLQILIVDQHGLKPRRRVLALRTVFQFSLAWWIVVMELMAAVGLIGFALTLGWFVLLALLVEIGCVLFSRRGRSLHDHLLGTRVVLDASTQ